MRAAAIAWYAIAGGFEEPVGRVLEPNVRDRIVVLLAGPWRAVRTGLGAAAIEPA